jgi:tRNA modification GTPase
MQKIDTIAAIATPTGNGGVGIIRISGYLVGDAMRSLLGKTIAPRYATYTSFLDANSSVIDSGIALYFPNPHSYTGEDSLELQGHGGAVVLDIKNNQKSKKKVKK